MLIRSLKKWYETIVGGMRRLSFVFVSQLCLEVI